MRIYYILVLYLFYGGTLLCAQVTKTPKKSTVKTTVANTETLSVWMSRNLNIQPPRKVGKVGIPKKINISSLVELVEDSKNNAVILLNLNSRLKVQNKTHSFYYFIYL